MRRNGLSPSRDAVGFCETSGVGAKMIPGSRRDARRSVYAWILGAYAVRKRSQRVTVVEVFKRRTQKASQEAPRVGPYRNVPNG